MELPLQVSKRSYLKDTTARAKGMDMYEDLFVDVCETPEGRFVYRYKVDQREEPGLTPVTPPLPEAIKLVNPVARGLGSNGRRINDPEVAYIDKPDDGSSIYDRYTNIKVDWEFLASACSNALWGDDRYRDMRRSRFLIEVRRKLGKDDEVK